MTKPYKKKLIEVAIPLEAINAASAREKSIRHGHPSTLHLWWARRPLAACRAVLFAQLVDDPSEDVDRLLNDPAIRKAAQSDLDERLAKRERDQGRRQGDPCGRKADHARGRCDRPRTTAPVQDHRGPGDMGEQSTNEEVLGPRPRRNPQQL